jgi:pimeloyl-ACP methyl ester carboxylesterase
MSRRLILFTGMGADSRLLSRIRVKGAELSIPDHEKPQPMETLSRYADRVADKWAIGPGDVVGGASFGGMMAAQIATTRKVAGAVLLGSCLDPARLPLHYRVLEAASPLLPDMLFDVRALTPLIRWRFWPADRESLACLGRMAADCPPRRLREFLRMAVSWPGVKPPSCPTLVVHGDSDRVIPIGAVKPDVVITGAGHAFTLTHAEETSQVLADFVARLG